MPDFRQPAARICLPPPRNEAPRASDEKSWSIQSSRRYPERFGVSPSGVQDRLCAVLSAARPLAYAPLGLRLPLDVLDLPRKSQAPAVPTGPAAAVAGLRASSRGAWLRRARSQSRYKVRRVDGYRQHEADRREHVGGNSRRYARKGSEGNNGDNANHVCKRVGNCPDADFRNSIISFVVRQCHGRNPSGLSCPLPRSR
ncbi:hypothetical protein FB008_101137 [Sinorhizobium medicae]|nr:hypothetical protein FB008_101137 [Sinorhizobium medicae]